jgi:chromosome segregation ATPase
LDTLETRFSAFDNRLSAFDNRLGTVETRLGALEEKVDARLRETRPIWEGIQARLTGIESELKMLNRQFRSMMADMFQFRVRVEALEDNQPA